MTDHDALHFVLGKIEALNNLAISLMAEIDPEALPTELVEAMTEMAKGILGVTLETVRAVQASGITLPPEILSTVNEWEAVLRSE